MEMFLKDKDASPVLSCKRLSCFYSLNPAAYIPLPVNEKANAG